MNDGELGSIIRQMLEFKKIYVFLKRSKASLEVILLSSSKILVVIKSVPKAVPSVIGFSEIFASATLICSSLGQITPHVQFAQGPVQFTVFGVPPSVVGAVSIQLLGLCVFSITNDIIAIL